MRERYRAVGRGRCGCQEKLCLALKPSVKVTFGAIDCIVFRTRVTSTGGTGARFSKFGIRVCFSSDSKAERQVFSRQDATPVVGTPNPEIRSLFVVVF